MPSTLSSDPPSQYCIDRNQARMSCALPGMKRRMRGRRRSIAICFSPEAAAGVLRAAEPLEEGHRAGGGQRHVEVAELGQLDDLRVAR